MGRIDDQLATLATMSPAQLRAEWMRVYRREAPALTPSLLRHGIGYRLQERASGGLTPAIIRQLTSLSSGQREGAAASTHIKPGTRLVRDWGGVTHHVLVADQGYDYRDWRFKSLSQIAFEITGAKWSGPRFFGLVGRGKARG